MQLSTPGPSDPIVAFYRGQRPDEAGRYLAEILKWDDDRLEEIHDYIQWLFPTRERSGVNPSAPLITSTTVAEFGADDDLHDALRRSFGRMLRFYGLRLEAAGRGVAVVLGDNYSERRSNWLRPGNHNHLRITRILACLVSLGLRPCAQAFADCLQEVYRIEGTSCISARSFRFWMDTLEPAPR